LSHRDRAWPVGLGIEGADFDESLPEIKIASLKSEQIVPT